MKCPKCGYNSFEYRDSCKKCSADLGEYKKTYAIEPIVLPPEVREQQAERFRGAAPETAQPAAGSEAGNDMFSFDLPEENAPAAAPAAAVNDDPFNFDYELPSAGSQQAKAEESGFSDLLESTSHGDDPFSIPVPAASPASATPSPAAPSSSTGEFDLDSFSWDSAPAATPADSAEQNVANDFDSFFGETADTTKK